MEQHELPDVRRRRAVPSTYSSNRRPPRRNIRDEAHRREEPPPSFPEQVAAHSAARTRPSPAIGGSASRSSTRGTSPRFGRHTARAPFAGRPACVPHSCSTPLARRPHRVSTTDAMITIATLRKPAPTRLSCQGSPTRPARPRLPPPSVLAGFTTTMKRASRCFATNFGLCAAVPVKVLLGRCART